MTDPDNFYKLNPWWRAAVKRQVAAAMRLPVAVISANEQAFIQHLAQEARDVRLAMGWFDFGFLGDNTQDYNRVPDTQVRELYPIPRLCMCPDCIHGGIQPIWHRIAAQINGPDWFRDAIFE